LALIILYQHDSSLFDLFQNPKW